MSVLVIFNIFYNGASLCKTDVPDAEHQLVVLLCVPPRIYQKRQPFLVANLHDSVAVLPKRCV